MHDPTRCLMRKRRGASIWAALLPVPAHRQSYAGPELGPNSRLTIELLFPSSDVDHLLTVKPIAGGSTILAATEAGKRQVASAAQTFPRESFIAFEPI